MTDAATQPSDIAQSTFRDRLAERLRGYGPVGIIAFLMVFAGALVFMPIAAALLLIWAWLSKTPFADLGLARPKSWVGGAIVGIALGAGLKLTTKVVVLPLLGAPAVNAAFHNLAGNLDATLDLAAYAIYGAGFAEEIFFRGYLFERGKKLFGDSAFATIATVILTTTLFAVAHWQQGIYGIANAGLVGLALAITYLVCRRRLWVPMVAHAAFDLTAAAMIYYDAETAVTHLIFK